MKPKMIIVIGIVALLFLGLGGFLQPASLVKVTDWDVHVVVDPGLFVDDRYLCSLDFDAIAWNLDDGAFDTPIYPDSVMAVRPYLTPYIDSASPITPTTAWVFKNWDIHCNLNLDGVSRLEQKTFYYPAQTAPANIDFKVNQGSVSFDLSTYDLNPGDVLTVDIWYSFDIRDNGVDYPDHHYGGRRIVMTIVLDTPPYVEPDPTVSTYSGIVKDTSGNFIENADITFGDANLFSDSDGYWQLDEIEVGEYLITIEKAGYITMTKEVIIAVNSTGDWGVTLSEIIDDGGDDGDDGGDDGDYGSGDDGGGAGGTSSDEITSEQAIIMFAMMGIMLIGIIPIPGMPVWAKFGLIIGGASGLFYYLWTLGVI